MCHCRRDKSTEKNHLTGWICGCFLYLQSQTWATIWNNHLIIKFFWDIRYSLVYDSSNIVSVRFFAFDNSVSNFGWCEQWFWCNYYFCKWWFFFFFLLNSFNFLCRKFRYIFRTHCYKVPSNLFRFLLSAVRIFRVNIVACPPTSVIVNPENRHFGLCFLFARSV
jgi:hypothetical protein